MRKWLSVGVIVLGWQVAAANASWVYWDPAVGGNGHYYQAVSVPGGITWDDAEADAVNEGGHLATTTSDLENSFVFGLIDAPQFWWDDPANNRSFGPWIGGNQLPNSPEPAGGWTWTTGEPFVYTNWCAGNPDDQSSGQDRLQFFIWGQLGRSDQWNDIWNDPSQYSASVVGYVIEVVPEPATLSLLALGSLGMMRRRRRKDDSLYYANGRAQQ